MVSHLPTSSSLVWAGPPYVGSGVYSRPPPATAIVASLLASRCSRHGSSSMA